MTKYDPYIAQFLPTSTSDANEREKAAITSYEEGWDEWDGPIWPWRQCDTEKIELQEVHQDEKTTTVHHAIPPRHELPEGKAVGDH